jgi:hypothetical protein
MNSFYFEVLENAKSKKPNTNNKNEILKLKKWKTASK